MARGSNVRSRCRDRNASAPPRCRNCCNAATFKPGTTQCVAPLRMWRQISRRGRWLWWLQPAEGVVAGSDRIPSGYPVGLWAARWGREMAGVISRRPRSLCGHYRGRRAWQLPRRRCCPEVRSVDPNRFQKVLWAATATRLGGGRGCTLLQRTRPSSTPNSPSVSGIALFFGCVEVGNHLVSNESIGRLKYFK
jgi:hypothetical protein